MSAEGTEDSMTETLVRKVRLRCVLHNANKLSTHADIRITRLDQAKKKKKKRRRRRQQEKKFDVTGSDVISCIAES